MWERDLLPLMILFATFHQDLNSTLYPEFTSASCQDFRYFVPRLDCNFVQDFTLTSYLDSTQYWQSTYTDFLPTICNPGWLRIRSKNFVYEVILRNFVPKQVPSFINSFDSCLRISFSPSCLHYLVFRFAWYFNLDYNTQIYYNFLPASASQVKNVWWSWALRFMS